MNLLTVSSPHLTRTGGTGDVMLLVILATLPGLTALTYFFGWGNLINVVWATTIAVASEALILKMRGRSLGFYLRDYSAVVTGILLGLALPPLAPWWLTLIAVSFAIIIAKHLYGGLGNNLFNPAMIGYALVLIAFPVEMTSWIAPRSLASASGEIVPLLDTLKVIFSFHSTTTFDAMTMATPLDAFKHKGDLTAEQVWAAEAVLSAKSWMAWQFVSLGYLIGGAYLLYRKVFTWHAPISMLLTLAFISSAFWLYEPNSFASPQLHLLGGATMLAAFFIITDPVTSATSVKGKLIYGSLIGLLIFMIRTWGNYPDAVAFSVLLMNFAAPFIDIYSQPRTYGHKIHK